ncbi:bacteriocin class II family protein [Streptococcus sp. 45]|uniref:bacteriocin class II family protein n=1 Tax=Streptococcus sp. 45 TaxID=1855326 RepID=UPI000B8A0C82
MNKKTIEQFNPMTTEELACVEGGWRRGSVKTRLPLVEDRSSHRLSTTLTQ